MAPPVLRYEVLYYKRTNKVHKSKGVSKLDGILTVTAPPLCTVKLVEANFDDQEVSDSEEEEEEPKRRQKGKWKKNCARKQSSGWSGVNRDISKKAFDDGGLNVDDTVVLPQYECQIVAVLSECTSTTKATAQAIRPKTAMQRKNPTITIRKAPLLKPKAMSRQLPTSGRKPNNLGPKQKASTNSGNTSWQARRVPPRQPQAAIKPIKGQTQTDESDSQEDEEENRPPNRLLVRNPLRKIGTSALLPKKRKLTAPPKQDTLQPQSSNNFPGAIGIVTVPPSVRAVLRPHQREGVAFLWNCLTGASPTLQQAAVDSGIDKSMTPKGCILADEMGLGKTLMTISIVFALHRRRKDHRFIVVCPSSLVSNWSKEFDKWIGKASQPKRVVIRKGGEAGTAAIRAFVPVKPNLTEVLIISYDLFRMNSSILTQAKQIGLLCVDEGHRLKNTSGSLTLTALEALNCDSRLLITGTPIQNNLSEFFNVANFVCPGMLGDLSSFRRVYERPISAANNKNATWEQRNKGHSQSRALENITKAFMLRRLQKDILKSLLPARTEFLLFCRPSKQQCDMYKSITSSAIDSNIAGASADALKVLTQVRKLCSHPSLLDESSQTFSASHNKDISLSGKLVVLEGLLHAIRRNSNDKVVIVSNFTTALSAITFFVLQKNNWSFKRLDGSTDQSERQNLVDSFNRGTPQQSFVFLLSSKAGGCGLNLIGANRLIMIDPDWNPATDMQAMARIYRQGQEKPCSIYRLFTSGTVEEVIYQRQYQKGNLATLTVNGNLGKSAQTKGFTKEELRDCFTLKEGCACDTKQKVGGRWPDYDGAKGLQSQGCFDAPLLTVADEQSDTLSFVHIVEDSEEATVEKDASENASLDSGSNASSSEDECEFEG